MARAIMVQGTASGVGKSLVAAGLCRIFRQDGYSVAPFKSQNMALNSFVTRDGLEMGRAQVVQAEAAGVEPSALMNPILLKPTGDATSQVVVDGEVYGVMSAVEYYQRKAEFIPVVRRAFAALSRRHDIVVIEGAGSPAEINLAENDIVNMGMAALAAAPVLLVGDIDRGGVFASLYGTVALLSPGDRARIKAIVVNKFRGDVGILSPGLEQLEKLTGIPVVGVVPWLRVDIDDEDGASPRLAAGGGAKALDAAVIRLPRISNFTDFGALGRHPAFGVRYVETARRLGAPDLVIIPGTKNTMADLLWMRQNGLEAGVKRLALAGVPVIGICGGFQMLGARISDPHRVEHGGEVRGMELLPVATVFAGEKVRARVTGTVGRLEGYFAPLAGARFEGYEIHMGTTSREEGCRAFAELRGGGGCGADGAVLGRVFGSYVHGLFDSGAIAAGLAESLLAKKGVAMDAARRVDPGEYKKGQYDLLAASMRGALDMEAIYRIAGMPPPDRRRASQGLRGKIPCE